MISDIAQWPVGPVRLIWRESNSASLPVNGVLGWHFVDVGRIVDGIDDFDQFRLD